MYSHGRAFGVNNLLGLLHSPRWIGLMLALPLLAIANFALAAQTTGAKTSAAGAAKFDHVQTGFNLTGQHALAPCDTCHVQGVFKGTPRDCASCHSTGNRMGAAAKPNKHIATVAACDTCHRVTSWTPATFSHVGVQPGACMTCHNGSTATGKPNGHILTTASCDTCHRTTVWIPAGFNHAGVTPGTCTTCHGVTATGKSTGHVVTTSSCDVCHRTSAWIPAVYDHTGVAPGTCATCHGINATGKPTGHVVTSSSCDVCHSTAAWKPAGFNHAGVVAGTCSTCHNGTTATGVGGLPTTRYPSYSGHVPITSWPSCDSCHKSYTSFTGAYVHKSVAVGKGVCTTCHKFHNAPKSCDSSGCHSSTNFSAWD